MDDTDLTSLIRLARPRDTDIGWFGPLFRTLGLEGVPFFGNMIGRRVLQISFREGFLGYQLLPRKERRQ